MADTSSAWQSRENVLQGDPNVIHLHKELHDHRQAIAEFTITMNQLAKAQIQQVQGPKKVNSMEVVQEDEIPSNVVQANEEVKIDIDENVEETQEDVNPSREHVIDIPEPTMPKANEPMPRPPPPYPQRLAKKNSENQFKKFIDMMKSLSINVPLVEALEQISDYAMFIKYLVTKKRSMNCDTIKMTHKVSAIVHSVAPKLEYPGAFAIPCTIGSADFAKALCDLGVSINLMPYSVCKTLRIGQPRPTSMKLQMVDRTMKRPLGIIDDVLVRVDKFILPADFVILDCEMDSEVPIILGRPFLAMGKALVDVEAGELTLRVGDKKVDFHVCKSMRQPNSNEVCSFVDLVTEVDSTLAVLQKRKKDIGWTLADIRGWPDELFIVSLMDIPATIKFSLILRTKKRLLLLVPMVVNPLCKLLEKDSKFHFNEDCMKAFELLKFKLTTTLIITAADWSFLFELMCDASDVAARAVLGKRINKIFHPIYHASKTMTDAQVNYTVTEKELLAFVFAMEKFRPYLMGTKVIVHTDHEALRYLMRKKDSKARLMRWVLLLQEFDLEIQDRKGSENQVTDHLYRLEEEGRPHDGLKINDSFPDEQILAISMTGMPWFADFANYLVSGIVSNQFSSNQRKKLKRDCLNYYWDDPYLFRIYTDGVIRRCVSEEEQMEIIEAFHSSPYGGHHGGARTATKVSSLYKDKMKYLHDKYIRNKEFKEGNLVLLFNSQLRMFPEKLKYKWSGPFEVVHVTPFGALDLKNKNDEVFRVKGHRVKHYLGKVDDGHAVALIHFK
ncbi:uncharacterized protein [Nicotiana tomentosiformis]|uniref:uncharacterized protein n=1 Tax=Nicotiana tomentosiformis TaxID=4098 RepID=UPI00388C35BC